MKREFTVGVFHGEIDTEEGEAVIRVSGSEVKFPAKHLNDLNVLTGKLRDMWLQQKGKQ